MKLIPTQIQKKLMYIPLLNVTNLFILFLNLRRAKVSSVTLMKLFMYILGYGLPVWFVFSAATRLLPSLCLVFYLGTIYFGPLAISFGSIRYQEKYT